MSAFVGGFWAYPKPLVLALIFFFHFKYSTFIINILIIRKPVLRGTYFSLIHRILSVPLFLLLCKLYSTLASFKFARLCNSYTMGWPPVRGDNPPALATNMV